MTDEQPLSEMTHDFLLDSSHPALLELEQFAATLTIEQRNRLMQWRDTWIESIFGRRVISLDRLNKSPDQDQVRKNMDFCLHASFGQQAARTSSTITETQQMGEDDISRRDDWGVMIREIQMLVIRREPA